MAIETIRVPDVKGFNAARSGVAPLDAPAPESGQAPHTDNWRNFCGASHDWRCTDANRLGFYKSEK